MSAPGIMDAPYSLKGDLTSDYLAGGTSGRGLLPAAVAREFIIAHALDSEFFADVNQDYMAMQNPEEYLDVAGMSGRVAQADVPGVRMTEDQRSSLAISREKLTPKWFRAGSFINYHVQKENIQREGIGEVVKNELARQGRVNLEEYSLIGDTTSEVGGLNVIDGLITKAVARGRVLDHTAEPVAITDTPFLNCLYALPKQFKVNPADLRMYVGMNAESVYWNWLTQNRAYGIKATFYENEAPGKRIVINGVKVKPLPMMPDDYILLTHRMNICPGFLVRMFLEEDRDIDAGVDKYIYRFAYDVEFAQYEGVVVYSGLNTGITETL